MSVHKLTAVVLLLVLVCSSALAASPAGMLYASGTVSVNGHTVTRSTAVFEGDVLTTNATSAGTVSFKGSSVLVNGNSAVTISKGNIALGAGSAAVQTTQGLMVQIGRITIVPSSQSARFRVVHNGTSVTIGAVEQDLKIQNGRRDIGLQAGKSITIPLSDNAAEPKQDDRKSAESVTEPQGGTDAAGTAGSTEGGLTPGLIAVLTSGISTALTAAMMLNQKSASPVIP